MKHILIAVTLAAASVAWAPAQPTIDQGVVEVQSRAQLVANTGSWDILAELHGGLYNPAESLAAYESVTVGTYYRVIPNLKVGALARLQAGVRHDNDVLPGGTAPDNFTWNDTSGRLEGVLMLDVSPRFQLGFLPTGNWVFMLKNRLEYNTFNGQASVMTRPELTWFWIRDRDPFLNLSLSWEIYFPLNFGSTLIYQDYPYLSALWHAAQEVGIELSGAYRTTVWSTSAAWTAASLPGYSVAQQTWVVSLGVVYTPSF